VGKYDPLTAYLRQAGTTEVPLTFAEVEEIIGGPLPASKKYPAWWSNNPSNNVMTRAWLAAGFQTERVDIEGRRLVFRRARKAQNDPRPHAAPGRAPGLLDRLRASLGGTVTVAPGVDLTAPTGEIWDAER